MRSLVAFFALALAGTAEAQPLTLQETPSLQARVDAHELPPLAGRLPLRPLVVDLAAKGRLPGKQGGTLAILLPREKDVRLMTVWGYARLVGYDENLALVPDIAESVDVEGDRVFTFHLRPGHKWSDGEPFTAEDFRYFWEDIANDPELSPAGPPAEILNAGEAPKVEILDAETVRYSWTKPFPQFLHVLAQAREPFIYRPAHYLRRFHKKYGDAAEIARLVSEAKLSSWAALHNQMDSMYNQDNPALPSLQPWIVRTAMPSQHVEFVRNPFFHRVDTQGHQLPYIDQIVANVAEQSLIPAKAAAGESDLQVRGLSFRDITSLKSSEASGNYRVYLWSDARASELALYPNLNANDPVWRALMRDRRFRLALSLGLNRADINKSLFFGIAREGNNTVLPESPLYDAGRATRNAALDLAEANRLLDELGLAAKTEDGIRLLSDGRPAEIVVETAGESAEETDILQLVAESWAKIGIRLAVKPSERSVLRNRVYSGEALMAAWPGWDNGVPTPSMSPALLAPTRQETLCWPKWGQFYESNGKLGEAPDMPEAKELLDLYAAWAQADESGRSEIWRKMLDLHADSQFVIGTVSGVGQPVVVKNDLRNVPEKAVFGWDPGAQLGRYRMDEFWLDR